MAHQWRKPICAVIRLCLVKTNGALGAPLGFSQWHNNGASTAQWHSKTMAAPATLGHPLKEGSRSMTAQDLHLVIVLATTAVLAALVLAVTTGALLAWLF
jgi:hypothetical protein